MRSADTKARILRVARDVFSELGYGATTFQEIATRADLTRPAINHYFVSKRVLYREVTAQAGNLVTTAVDRARRETTLIGQLASFTESMAQPDEEIRSIGTFVFTAMLDAQRRPELHALLNDPQVDTRDFLSRAITDAVERGELVTGTDIPALVAMLTAILWGVGFYVAFVGGHEESATLTANLRLLLATELWRINQPPGHVGRNGE